MLPGQATCIAFVGPSFFTIQFSKIGAFYTPNHQKQPVVYCLVFRFRKPLYLLGFARLVKNFFSVSQAPFQPEAAVYTRLLCSGQELFLPQFPSAGSHRLYPASSFRSRTFFHLSSRPPEATVYIRLPPSGQELFSHLFSTLPSIHSCPARRRQTTPYPPPSQPIFSLFFAFSPDVPQKVGTSSRCQAPHRTRESVSTSSGSSLTSSALTGKCSASTRPTLPIASHSATAARPSLMARATPRAYPCNSSWLILA